MAGPWEKFQNQPAPAPSPPQSGPWSGYGPGQTPQTQTTTQQPDQSSSGSALDTAKEYGETLLQGAVLDPFQKVGQMAQHLPGRLGATAREMASDPLPNWLQNIFTQSKQAADRHPVVRTLANIAPWLAAGGGSGALVDAAMGAVGGMTQPLDPSDPHYWRDVMGQGVIGGVAGGTLGALGRGIADRAAQITRPVLNLIGRAYREAGLSGAPTAITPQTAVQARRAIGQQLGRIYDQMSFNPMNLPWMTQARTIRNTISGAIADPAQRMRWEQSFMDDAIRPAFQSQAGVTGAPLTGDKLHQLVSALSGEANVFRQEAQRGGAQAKTWTQMAQGMRQILNSVERQIDMANPALGAARRGAERGYQFADVVYRAGNAGNRWTPSAEQLASTWERKVGKAEYAGPRYGRAKAMLERERDILPPRREGALEGLGRHAVAGGLSHAVGLPFIAGPVARLAARSPAVRRGVAAVGQHPGAVGAATGRQTVAPFPGWVGSQTIPEITVTAPRYRPGQENQ